MKAATFDNYGPADVLNIEEVDTPSVGANEVLVEVHASEVTQGDRRIRSSDFPGVLWLVGRLMFGLIRPRNRVPGSVFAGRVAAVGDAVTEFEVGQDVYGLCTSGAYAEYLRVGEDSAIARMPGNVSYEEAATLPYGAATAQTFLRDIGGVETGDRVLVVGAAGGVGRFAIQYASHLGAHVVGVCSGDDADLVRRLGADDIVDYRTEDITARDEVFDIIVDTSGTASFGAYRRILAPEGRLLSLDIKFRLVAAMVWGSLGGGKSARIGVSAPTRADLEALAAIVEGGALRPVVDRHYELDDIREAHRHLEQGRPRGSVVVSLRAAGPLGAA
jgi:NADPH:quinone reductase-like Zn-dependent oxidoreductase